MSGGYDAVRGGLGEAELSSNDAYAVTLPMHLSNFLAIDDHSEAVQGFYRPSSRVRVRQQAFLGASTVRNFNFLAWFCGLLRTLSL